MFTFLFIAFKVILMPPEKSLVIYRNRPALVSGFEGEKINIAVFKGESFKVREKDIELLHPGPCSLKDLETGLPNDTCSDAREVWELLAGDTPVDTSMETSKGIPLNELAELLYGGYTPRSAWAAWELLKEGLYFTGDIRSVRARKRAAVEEEEKKREEKGKETVERAVFLERLKKRPPTGKGAFSPEDYRFLQDVEALAFGKTDKSRTMRELGRPETREEAHRLLLTSGAWTVWVNPHPDRLGLSRESAKIVPPPPPEEDRLDLTGMEAFAIDNPWSDDPDDAVSLDGPDADGKHTLWVHLADPAASVYPGSPADVEAMGRGATLYLPEGPLRMLSSEALSSFALGRVEKTPALSIKLTLMPDLNIGEVAIQPSFVRVTCLSYPEADALMAGGESEKASGAALTALAALAERNLERRLDMGAVVIDLPETHIKLNLGENLVSIEPAGEYRSTDLVRECMILAGEGAAHWALQRQVPFPYISQEAGELPVKRLPGLAGAWQLRRCMRPRSLSVKPGVHWGLGLDEYTQVTSPLRRYTDLLCHQQIRAWIGAGIYRGQKPLSEEEVLFRISAAEAAASTAGAAERASRAHWMAVYLSLKEASLWEGVVLDRKGSRGTVIIPALGVETQVNLRGTEEPNDKVNLSLLSVKIPEGEAIFSNK